jgi:hypothetical protein
MVRDLSLRMLLAGLVACHAPAQTAFVQLEICVHDASNLRELMGELRSIAHSEHMDFADGSSTTETSLRDANAHAKTNFNTESIVDWYLSRPDGVSVMINNLGLRSQEVSLSFFEGSNPNAARRFSAEVVRRLGTKWQVVNVPPSLGHVPLDHCP